MFTLAAATAAATFAVNPMLSRNVAVISLAVLAVNPRVPFFEAGDVLAVIFFATVPDFFTGFVFFDDAFFAALAMIGSLLDRNSRPQSRNLTFS
jgi:hypothetical protein